MTNLSIHDHYISSFGMTTDADGGIPRDNFDHDRMKLDPVWRGVIALNIYRRGSGSVANGAAGHDRQGNTEGRR
jgi:hypothetical protein